MRILLCLGAMLIAAGCGPTSRSSDDAGVVSDAKTTADARPGTDGDGSVDAGTEIDGGAEPDAGATAGAAVRSGAVVGGVKASSTHYKIIGTVSEGGSAPASASFQLREGVHGESSR